MAAAASSKLLNVGKNGAALQSLIHRNLLRNSAGSISQTLNSAVESPIRTPVNREVPELKRNAHGAAEVPRTMRPTLGVAYGAMALRGIDQSGSGRVFTKPTSDYYDDSSDYDAYSASDSHSDSDSDSDSDYDWRNPRF